MLALVDDDTAVRGALAFDFETAGYRVVAFPDAESALGASNPHLWRCLILDHRLPGMSGLDLLDELRARSVRAPAVLITSNPSATTRARAMASGVHIVEKPLLNGTLASHVHQLLKPG